MTKRDDRIWQILKVFIFEYNIHHFIIQDHDWEKADNVQELRDYYPPICCLNRLAHVH